MKVLLVDDDPILTRVLEQALARGGCRVDVSKNGGDAIAKIEKQEYDAVVTDWMLPEIDGITLLRKVREMTKGKAPFLVMTSALCIPDARAHALASGADTFFAKPVLPSELLHALVVGTSARKKPVAQMELGALVSGIAWLESPRTLRTSAIEMVQTPLELDEAAAFPKDPLSAILPVIDVGHRLELTMGIAASVPSAISVARALAGDPPPTDVETLEDLMAEVINIAMGSLKAMYGREGYVLTAGLPKKGTFKDRASFESSHGASHVHFWKGQGMQLVLALGARLKGNAVVGATRLIEDMVLAQDVRNAAGVLILPAGTRLTATAIERLRNYGLKGDIEVVVPQR